MAESAGRDWTPGDPVHVEEQHPTAERLGLPNDGSDPVLAAYGLGYAQAMKDAGMLSDGPRATEADPFTCRQCGVPEDACQASPRPCCIVCAELNTSTHLSRSSAATVYLTCSGGCCEATRLDEAGAWIDTGEQLQAEVARLREVEQRRDAMLALHCGLNGVCASGTCGDWPCATYLACYPEIAWKAGEQP